MTKACSEDLPRLSLLGVELESKSDENKTRYNKTHGRVLLVFFVPRTPGVLPRLLRSDPRHFSGWHKCNTFI